MTDDAGEARELAAVFWQAIDGFNFTSLPIKPNSRRLGMALVSIADRKTGAIFPSELYLAGLLNLTTRAIRTAKAELREHGLIDWTNPGGPRHRSRYMINWPELRRHAQDGKERAKDTRLGGEIPKRYRNGRSANYRNGASALDSDGTVQPENSGRHAENSGRPIGTDVPQNLPFNLPSDLTQHLHDGTCALGSAVPHADDGKATDTGDVEPEEALENEAARPAFATVFPKIWEAFEDDDEAVSRLERFDHDSLKRVSATLARQGEDAARKIVMGA